MNGMCAPARRKPGGEGASTVDDAATAFPDLSRREFGAIIELGHACVSARSVADLERVIDRLATLLSFDRAVLCSVEADRAQPDMRHFLNHSYGTAWADLYTRRNYVTVDPVVRHALATNGAFAWDEAFRAGAGQLASEFLEAARDFGLVHGAAYACGAAAALGATRIVLSVSVDDPIEFSRAKLMLAGVGPHLHEAYARLCAHAPPDGRHAVLTAREKEVLKWAVEGKTYWEIGRILGISERTVKFHFSNIKAALDAVSECHAVAKAMSMGLLR